MEPRSEPERPARQTTMEPESPLQEPAHSLDALVSSRSATELAHLLQTLAQHYETIIREEKLALLQVAPSTENEYPSVRMEKTGTQPDKVSTTQEPVMPETEPHELAEETLEERDARIERAYLELKAEGKRISGRALVARAYIHRSICNHWLENYQQGASLGGPEQENKKDYGASSRGADEETRTPDQRFTKPLLYH